MSRHGRARFGGRGAIALLAAFAMAVIGVAPAASATDVVREGPVPAAALDVRAAADEPDPFIRDVQTWMTTSASDRTYKISVALPARYDPTAEPYRVLYVTDANAEFGIAVETARLVAPGTVVVGIGYDDPGQGFAASGTRRALDLTPTTIAAAAATGGAPEFLAFLRDELVPDIEAEYNVSSTDRALMGHSFGGLFGVYTLLHNDGLFQRFVIASPSLWWDENTMFDAEEAYAATEDALPARVFLSVGSLEETTSGFPMTSDMTRFALTLVGRDYDELQLGAHVFPDEDHTSVIGASFSRGLRYIYAAPGTTVPGTDVADLGAPLTSVPGVITEPEDVVIDTGTDATFVAAATGVPTPTVQWQQLRSGTEWENIPAATAPTLLIDAADVTTATQYRAVFTNTAGEAVTRAALLTVDSVRATTPDPTATGAAVADAASADGLASTGTEASVAMLSVGIVLLLGGAVLVAARRTAASRQG